MRAIYIGCIGTHAHGHQVTSFLCCSGVIMWNCILAYSGDLWKLILIGEQEKESIIGLRIG